MLEEISCRVWEKYGRSIALFERYPKRYYAKLAWLFIQSCLMLFLITGNPASSASFREVVLGFLFSVTSLRC